MDEIAASRERRLQTVAVYCGAKGGKSSVFAENVASERTRYSCVASQSTISCERSYADLQTYTLHFRLAGLGAYLGQNQMKVVYGGSRYGLLGKMADAVLSNGGSITGIIPEFFTSM